ncbi:MAG: hypothetical protein K2N71_12870, partial [Oscillospiraceae bacterium]|nr:hypothetical protein [Oscillospiraceae bacterium]
LSMSDSVEYKKKYEHNEAFVAYVQASSDFPDWEIIGTFYAALHFMNLYLSKRYNVDISEISSHVKRNDYITEKCNSNIARVYKTLYDLSREARYQFTDISKKTEFVKKKYSELKSSCQKDMAAMLS